MCEGVRYTCVCGGINFNARASDKAYDIIDELVKSPFGIKEPTVTGLLLGYWANGSWDEGDGEDPVSLAKAKYWVEHGSFLSENDKNK